MISVSLPDGSERELAEGSSGADLASAVGPRLAADALVAVVDGAEKDLAAPLPDGSSVEIVTASSARGLHTIRHSTAHVLAQAVLDLYPGATFAIGPPIEHGFYYDFELPDGGTFTDADLERIEARMREIVAADQPFERMEVECGRRSRAVRTASLQAGHHRGGGVGRWRRRRSGIGSVGGRHRELLPQRRRPRRHRRLR